MLIWPTPYRLEATHDPSLSPLSEFFFLSTLCLLPLRGPFLQQIILAFRISVTSEKAVLILGFIYRADAMRQRHAPPSPSLFDIAHFFFFSFDTVS